MLEKAHDLSQYAKSLGVLVPVKCTSKLYDKVLNPSGAKIDQAGMADVYYRLFDVLLSLIEAVNTEKGMPGKGAYAVELKDPEGAITSREDIGFVLERIEGEDKYEITLCTVDEAQAEAQ